MSFDYTDSEIRSELAHLGYVDVTEDQLQVFKKQLMRLMLAERNKRIFQKHFGDIPEATGNSRNHGNQMLYSNNMKEWLSRDASDTLPYSQPMNSLVLTLTQGSNHGEYNKHPVDGGYQRGYSFMNSPNLTSANSEPNLKPKNVKWKFSREGTFDRTAEYITRESFGSIECSGKYDEIKSRINRKDRRDGNEEITRPVSAMSELRQGTKNVIGNMPGTISHKEHPHTRNLYRTKPFERHQMYLRAWRAQPPVGEASRNALIWQIHKRLLKKEEVKYHQKTLIPNSYVVPTTKPRYELRWAVRQCNENYVIPPCGFFHEM